MAYRTSPAVCSLPAYQTFMPLSGFPPALGYCSTTAFLSKRTDDDTAGVQTPSDFQCPAESSYLCDLLSELKASDHEFTRSVCCCIGVCLGTQPTALVTVSVTTSTDATTDSSTSTPGAAISTISNANSNTVTSPPSEVSTTSDSSSSTSSSLSTAPSGPFPTSISDTSLSSSSSSSSSLPTTSSSASSSSTSSSSSSSTATCPITVTADPSCSTLAATGGVAMTYTQYFAGQYVVESIDNPGNDNTNFGPIYSSLPGTLSTCDAVTDCANIADSPTFDASNVYYSFDLHYLASNATWECVVYYDPNIDGSYFNVAEPDACLALGYAEPDVAG